MSYRILFKDKDEVDKDLLREIQDRHWTDLEGLNELYNSLISHGTCESEIASRIYYLAYTLALENIELVLVRVN